jgi:hypothetical protein
VLFQVRDCFWVAIGFVVARGRLGAAPPSHFPHRWGGRESVRYGVRAGCPSMLEVQRHQSITGCRERQMTAVDGAEPRYASVGEQVLKRWGQTLSELPT